jgi:hypothetical protein
VKSTLGPGIKMITNEVSAKASSCDVGATV